MRKTILLTLLLLGAAVTSVAQTLPVTGTFINLPYQDVRNKYTNPEGVDGTDPQMWAATGVDYPTLLDTLLRTALDEVSTQTLRAVSESCNSTIPTSGISLSRGSDTFNAIISWREEAIFRASFNASSSRFEFKKSDNKKAVQRFLFTPVR